jgi:outer membrane lipoprotein carrier protein
LLSATPAPTSAQVIDRLQETYDSTADLQAAFEQVYHFKVNGLERRSSGQVFLKKPGKMRWDYTKPNPRYFISDGVTLWIYVPADAQAFEQPIERSQVAAALSFLLGEGDLAGDFDHQLLPAGPQGQLRLQLVPKKSTRQYRKLVLSLDPETFRVVGTLVEDPVGNLNTLTFLDLRVNQGLPDAGFDFTPPEGTRVVRSRRRR